QWLNSNANYLLLIEGHCDERGTNDYNLALGDRRAKAAMNYLVAQGVRSVRSAPSTTRRAGPRTAALSSSSRSARALAFAEAGGHSLADPPGEVRVVLRRPGPVVDVAPGAELREGQIVAYSPDRVEELVQLPVE